MWSGPDLETGRGHAAGRDGCEQADGDRRLAVPGRGRADHEARQGGHRTTPEGFVLGRLAARGLQAPRPPLPHHTGYMRGAAAARVASGRVPLPADSPLAGWRGVRRRGGRGHGDARQLAAQQVPRTQRHQRPHRRRRRGPRRPRSTRCCATPTAAGHRGTGPRRRRRVDDGSPSPAGTTPPTRSRPGAVPSQGEVGFEIVTPLVLDDGTAVLVDRGWVPAGGRWRDSPPRRCRPAPTGHGDRRRPGAPLGEPAGPAGAARRPDRHPADLDARSSRPSCRTRCTGRTCC